MQWLKVYRIALIIDSAIFVLKLWISIFLIVSGVELKQWNDKREPTDSSHLTVMLIFVYFIGGSLLFILTLLRFLTNLRHHRTVQELRTIRNYERYINPDEDSCCSKCFACCSCCWYALGIVHILIDAFLIAIDSRIDWTHGGNWGEWLGEIVIGFLCWEILIFCFMVAFKVLYSKVAASDDSKTENSTATQQTEF